MSDHSSEIQFAIAPKNYKFIIAGVAILILGFVLMSGGAAESVHEFHYDEIFSTTRITVAPLTCLVGYALVMVGILKK